MARLRPKPGPIHKSTLADNGSAFDNGNGRSSRGQTSQGVSCLVRPEKSPSRIESSDARLLERFVHRLRRRLWLIPLALLSVCAAVAAADWFMCLPEGVTASYVGRSKCIQCHQQEYDKWSGSDHDLAMNLATPETVLGDFNNGELKYHNTTSRMFRQGDKFLVTTDGPDGKPGTFEVKYVFGVRPLQQYLVEFPDGRVQVLPMAWDVNKKRWFHIYQNETEPVRTDEWIHWTRSGQNWNYMCADCHSTNLRKNFDLKTNTYHTEFSEIDVSCEECHGPGSTHVQLAEGRSIFWDRRYGYGLAKLKVKDNKPQLETCAKCHSRRRVVAEGYRAGEPYMDYFAAELLDGELYYPDGQILEEDYVYGSFLQSLMYRKGVRCTDCHDPHTAKLKFEGNKLWRSVTRRPSTIRPRTTTICSTARAARCVECHMPETTYMVVDPRRDHSIRPPRPDLSLLLDTPNACVGCHLKDKKENREKWRDYAHCLQAVREGDAEAKQELDRLNHWADDATLEWYGAKRRSKPHFALALAAGRRGELEPGAEQTGDPQAVRKEIVRRLVRLAKNGDAGPIVRASAVALLGRYPTMSAQAANEQALQDGEPMVRLAAVRNLESFNPIRASDMWSYRDLPAEARHQLQTQFERLRKHAAPRLTDQRRAVRAEAARVLSIVPPGVLTGGERQAFKAALAEFKAGQLASADQGAAHLSLGAVYGNQGRLDLAEESYKTAIRVQPEFVPARINLSLLYNHQGKKDEAAKLLREAIDYQPAYADGHYYLGLLLAEDPRQMPDALKELEQAANLASDRPRIHYNYALALQQQDRWQESADELKLALRLDPDSADYANALVSLYRQRRQWTEALKYAETLMRLLPDNPQAQQLYFAIRRQAEGAGTGPRP